MTKVAVVSYYFPPLGGAGVQRTLKFVRFLPQFGIETCVVAGPVVGTTQWEPTDANLAAEMDANAADTLRVYRSNEAPEAGSTRLDRWLGKPAGIERWWASALVPQLEQAIAEQQPDVLFVTVSPFSALEPTLELGRKHKLPVVADFRDPWALDAVTLYPTSFHRKRTTAKMRRLMERADHVIMNTPDALAAVLQAFPKLSASKLSVVTNGYDRDDFAGSNEPDANSAFTILHTGYLHTAFGFAYARRSGLRKLLGGESCPVDFLGRSHYYLLAALRLLAERGVDLSSVHLKFLGVLSDEDKQLIASDSPLAANQVECTGYVDHNAAVAQQASADLLFLPLHALPAGRRSRIVPGKTYEYLASGRPILAALPEGDARDFIEAANAGACVEPNDVEAMANEIEAALLRGHVPTRQLGPATKRFERRELTRQLAEILKSVS